MVVKVGPGVDHVIPGDLVGVNARGCLASKVIVPAGDVNRLYNSVSTKDAASLAVYLTAYHALVDLCRLRKGDRVLVHAAAGGVGHAAISICRHFEADVYATVSHAKREYWVKTLGVLESQRFYPPLEQQADLLAMKETRTTTLKTTIPGGGVGSVSVSRLPERTGRRRRSSARA